MVSSNIRVHSACMGQELERFEQEENEAMGSFNELLKKSHTDVTSNQQSSDLTEDARADELPVSIDPVQANGIPEGAATCKPIDTKAVPTLTVHKDAQGHYYLTCSADTKIPRGTKIASVGSGKPVEKQDNAKSCLSLEFLRGDKTWVEVMMGGNTEGEDDSKTKRGTLYAVSSFKIRMLCVCGCVNVFFSMMIPMSMHMSLGVDLLDFEVCRDLFKNSSHSTITITGFRVKPSSAGSGGSNKHGFTVEATEKSWAYQLKDKTETKTTGQNFATWNARGSWWFFSLVFDGGQGHSLYNVLQPQNNWHRSRESTLRCDPWQMRMHSS